MATQWQTFPIEFNGGLISNLSPLQQGTNAVGSATLLQNFETSKLGGYSKLKGYEKYSTTQVPGTGPVLGLKVISSGRIVASRKNASNKTEYYFSTGTTWTSITETALTNGKKARSALYNLGLSDKVIFVDGVNFPVIYNTAGNTIVKLQNTDVNVDGYTGTNDPLGAEHVAIFKSTAFYAKGNTLFFTAPFSVDDFSAANGAGSISVSANITGLAIFRDQLIIFTTNTVQRLTGSTAADFQVSPITDRIGCINGDTIQEFGGDIIYLAPDGIRLLSATDRIGDFGLDIASDKIAKDSIAFLGSTPIFSSVILREKGQYRIFAYVESENVTSAKGLIATKFISQGGTGVNWSTTKGIKAYASDSRYTNTEETIAFSNSDGYVYIMDTGSSFDGAAIEAIYESPFMPLTDPQVRKSFYKMTLYAQPSGNMSLDLNLKYNFDSSSDLTTVQPDTQQIVGTGTSVFIYGDSKSLFASSDRVTGVDTEGNPRRNTLLVSPAGPWLTYPNQAGPFYNEEGETFSPATYGGELDNIYNTNVIGSGKTLAIRIEDNTTNPTFTLDTALIEFSQEDRQ
jgi:hypothetical protein